MSGQAVVMQNLEPQVVDTDDHAEPRFWGTDRFRYHGDAVPNDNEPYFLDLTGRRRILIWGPYETLQAGPWKAVVKLSFDKRATNYIYAIEFGSVKRLVRHEFSVDKEGIYEVDVEINLRKAVPAEVRIILDQGVVGGVLGFYGVEIQRVI